MKVGNIISAKDLVVCAGNPMQILNERKFFLYSQATVHSHVLVCLPRYVYPFPWTLSLTSGTLYKPIAFVVGMPKTMAPVMLRLFGI